MTYRKHLILCHRMRNSPASRLVLFAAAAACAAPQTPESPAKVQTEDTPETTWRSGPTLCDKLVKRVGIALNKPLEELCAATDGDREAYREGLKAACPQPVEGLDEQLRTADAYCESQRRAKLTREERAKEDEEARKEREKLWADADQRIPGACRALLEAINAALEKPESVCSEDNSELGKRQIELSVSCGGRPASPAGFQAKEMRLKLNKAHAYCRQTDPAYAQRLKPLQPQ